MEEELDGMKIEVYGNISDETFAKVEKFTYLCGKYME